MCRKLFFLIFPVFVLGLTGSILAGLIIFGICSYLIKSPELLNVVSEVKKGLSKK